MSSGVSSGNAGNGASDAPDNGAIGTTRPNTGLMVPLLSSETQVRSARINSKVNTVQTIPANNTSSLNGNSASDHSASPPAPGCLNLPSALRPTLSLSPRQLETANSCPPTPSGTRRRGGGADMVMIRVRKRPTGEMPESTLKPPAGVPNGVPAGLETDGPAGATGLPANLHGNLLALPRTLSLNPSEDGANIGRSVSNVTVTNMTETSQDFALDDIYETLRLYVNQYVGVSVFAALITFVILVLDVSQFAGFATLSSAGEVIVLTLDAITLAIFTLEVAVSLLTLGCKHFMEDFWHRVDLYAVVCVNLLYILSWILRDLAVDRDGDNDILERDRDFVETIAHVFRSVLRLARLVIMAVRVDMVLRGSTKDLTKRLESVLLWSEK